MAASARAWLTAAVSPTASRAERVGPLPADDDGQALVLADRDDGPRARRNGAVDRGEDIGALVPPRRQGAQHRRQVVAPRDAAGEAHPVVAGAVVVRADGAHREAERGVERDRLR